MATMPDGRPLLIGPTPIRDWLSKQVSFSRFLKAFNAALSFQRAGPVLQWIGHGTNAP